MSDSELSSSDESSVVSYIAPSWQGAIGKFTKDNCFGGIAVLFAVVSSYAAAGQTLTSATNRLKCGTTSYVSNCCDLSLVGLSMPFELNKPLKPMRPTSNSRFSCETAEFKYLYGFALHMFQKYVEHTGLSSKRVFGGDGTVQRNGVNAAEIVMFMWDRVRKSFKESLSPERQEDFNIPPLTQRLKKLLKSSKGREIVSRVEVVRRSRNAPRASLSSNEARASSSSSTAGRGTRGGSSSTAGLGIRRSSGGGGSTTSLGGIARTSSSFTTHRASSSSALSDGKKRKKKSSSRSPPPPQGSGKSPPPPQGSNKKKKVVITPQSSSSEVRMLMNGIGSRLKSMMDSKDEENARLEGALAVATEELDTTQEALAAVEQEAEEYKERVRALERELRQARRGQPEEEDSAAEEEEEVEFVHNPNESEEENDEDSDVDDTREGQGDSQDSELNSQDFELSLSQQDLD